MRQENTRYRRLIVWTVLLVLLSGTISVAPQTAASEPPKLSRDKIDAAIKTRTQFGLPIAINAIQYASTVEGRDLSLLGTPLSPDEAADIRARDERSALAGSMSEILTATRPDSFGGTWIDQRAGGVIHVASTQSLSEPELADLSRQFLDGSPIVYNRVAHSLTSLEATKSVFADLMLRRSGIGKWAIQVSVRVKDNRVLLRVDSSVPPSLVSEAERTYNDLTVEVTANRWVT